MDPLTRGSFPDAPEGGRDEVRALLALDRMPGVGLSRLRRLVVGFGSAAVALRAPAAAFREVAGVARSGPDAATFGEIDAELDVAQRLGMAVCTWSSQDYPSRLHHLHDPPPVLFLRGRRELLASSPVTVVGSRRATARGRDVSERLGREIAATGVGVASGLALGVDAAAHRGALAVGGATLAVMGRGADAPYPPSHRRLFDQVVETGLVLSEFPPGVPPMPHHFPRRNRILAAIARAVVVVEARTRSGALITVDHALDVGVDVWAVPGPIDTPGCAGSNALLVDGARPLVSTTAFVEEVCGAPSVERAADASRGPAGASARLLAELVEGDLHVDDLAPRAGIPVREALTLLLELEVDGRVRKLAGMRFRLVA